VSFHNGSNGHETNNEGLALFDGDVHLFANTRTTQEVARGNDAFQLIKINTYRNRMATFQILPQVTIFLNEALVFLEHLHVQNVSVPICNNQPENKPWDTLQRK